MTIVSDISRLLRQRAFPEVVLTPLPHVEVFGYLKDRGFPKIGYPRKPHIEDIRYSTVDSWKTPILIDSIRGQRSKSIKAKETKQRNYLQIFHGIPIVFNKDDSVCTRQIQTQTSNVCRQ